MVAFRPYYCFISSSIRSHYCCQSCHAAGLQTQGRELWCHSCGYYSGGMKTECEEASRDKVQVCKECWMYRRESHGSTTYARGCKSLSSLVKSDNCDEYTTESCSTVDGTTLCRKCCKSDRCNNWAGPQGVADITVFSFHLLLITVSLSLTITGLL
ncbi:hypothetical protein NP493_451g02001 [Ridgeia piscesae]|uniref:Uncharacterized protein n=1 Tax=Ridgeia piscesae TaxID=27915 RepID=A0AAD9NTP8_RIDPI|nr:hypothetical protein NP493_451g02001 [Ridgeia piscesae]